MQYWLETVESIQDGVGFSPYDGVHLSWLTAYPVMLVAGGDVRPEIRYAPKCAALLAGQAVVALAANLLLDTNFMFLMSADPGNPLYLFEQAFGDHRIGFAVLLPAILAVMYAPVEIFRRVRQKV